MRLCLEVVELVVVVLVLQEVALRSTVQGLEGEAEMRRADENDSSGVRDNIQRSSIQRLRQSAATSYKKFYTTEDGDLYKREKWNGHLATVKR